MYALVGCAVVLTTVLVSLEHSECLAGMSRFVGLGLGVLAWTDAMLSFSNSLFSLPAMILLMFVSLGIFDSANRGEIGEDLTHS